MFNSRKQIHYTTRFSNKSAKPWAIFSRSGRRVMDIQPGESKEISTTDPTADFARFKSLTRMKDELVSVVANRDWSPPWQSDYYIELINEGHRAEESLRVFGSPLASKLEYVTVRQGVPVLTPVHLSDPLCFYREVRWKRVNVERPIHGTAYFFRTPTTQCEKVERSPEEIKEILEKRKAVIMKAAEREADASARAVGKGNALHSD